MGFKMDEDTFEIEITRGDSGHELVTVRLNGNVYEMQEGDEIHFGVKEDYDDKVCLFTKTYKTNPFILAIEPADTKPLDFGKYHYDMQIVFANGFTRTFIEKKLFRITEEVV